MGGKDLFYIRFRRRSQSEWLLLFAALFPFVCQFLITGLHVPAAVKYLIDLALALALVINLPRINRQHGRLYGFWWIIAFAIYAVAGSLINYQSVIYLLWGLRNTFRFYVFFLLCVLVFKKRDIPYFFKSFDVLFVLNVILVSIQYWMMGYNRDHLGGLFGTGIGCNGAMNIFLVIVLSKSILSYMTQKTKLSKCMTVVMGAVYIAALAEMKFLFVELFLIAAAASLITAFSWRKFAVIVGVFALALLGIDALIMIFPEWANAFTLDGLLSIALSEQGYTGAGDLNRLTGVQILASEYMDSPFEVMFGLGLGNCDYSETFTFLQTPFYRMYDWLHYTWFSSTFVFAELGIIGLVFFFGFFAVIFKGARKKTKELGEFKLAGQLAQVVSILCIAIGVYDSSLRIECGYMAYLVLALPFLRDAAKRLETAGVK